MTIYLEKKKEEEEEKKKKEEEEEEEEVEEKEEEQEEKRKKERKKNGPTSVKSDCWEDFASGGAHKPTWCFLQGAQKCEVTPLEFLIEPMYCGWCIKCR